MGECEALGITVIAITDHWCADSASGLIAYATDRGIAALPGFEANCSEGVHIANGGMLTGRKGQPLVAMVKDPNLHLRVPPNKTLQYQPPLIQSYRCYTLLRSF